VTLFSMVFNTNKMGDWTLRNTYLLTVMTMAHVLGEIAHFLINTSGREVARDLHFGELACFVNESHTGASTKNCSGIRSKDGCVSDPHCYWDYSGLGIEYQILSGPAFVAIFSTSAVLLSVFSDKYKDSIPRVVMVGAGTAVLASGLPLAGTGCIL